MASRSAAMEADAPLPATGQGLTATPATAPDGTAGVLGMVQRLRELVRFDGRRFEASLSPVVAAVLVGGVLLALLVSYQLGRRSGSSAPPVADAARPGVEVGFDGPAVGQGEPAASATGEVRAAESVPPPVPVRSSPSPEPKPPVPSAANKAEVSLPKAPPAVAAGRVPGLNYIVVERFHTGLPQVKGIEDARQQAEQAQRWLAERCNLQTAIYPMSNGKGYELWTVQGFKHPEQTPQREELADKIRSYGKLYAKEGHYLFGCEARKY